jgi:hypothetical protein
MDFQAAIGAHQKWKIRLRMVIDGKSTETLDPNIVCKNDQCDLGKWIQGEGGKILGARPEFTEVKTTHDKFHVVAASVLKRALAGDKAGANTLLDGDYYDASSKVVQAISKCSAVCK